MKIFDGFALSMASDFSGLTLGEINYVVKQQILTPDKDSRGGFKYSFSEILMLRLIRLLKLYKVEVKNIKKARAYLKDINPQRDLTNVKLYVRTDTKAILYLGEKPQEGILVDASQYGQLVSKNVLEILPVGRDLEIIRKEVIHLDAALSKRSKSSKIVPFEEVFAQYGVS